MCRFQINYSNNLNRTSWAFHSEFLQIQNTQFGLEYQADLGTQKEFISQVCLITSFAHHFYKMFKVLPQAFSCFLEVLHALFHQEWNSFQKWDKRILFDLSSISKMKCLKIFHLLNCFYINLSLRLLETFICTYIDTRLRRSKVVHHH